MSTDLLADSLQQSLGGDSFLYEEPTDIAAVAEGCGSMGGGGVESDFVGVSVGDFDLGEEMQLDGFPIDLWPGAMEPSLAEETLGKIPIFRNVLSSYFFSVLIAMCVTRGIRVTGTGIRLKTRRIRLFSCYRYFEVFSKQKSPFLFSPGMNCIKSEI
jgi:hypothetical protein